MKKQHPPSSNSNSIFLVDIEEVKEKKDLCGFASWRYNLVIVVLAAIFVVVSVGTGVGFFFFQQGVESRQLSSQLFASSVLYFQNLQRIMERAIRETELLKAHAAVMLTGGNFSIEHFEQFTSQGSSLENGAESLQWIPVIRTDQIDELNEMAKTLGPYYSNYWVKEVDGEFGRFRNVSRDRSTYHPILYAAPIETQSFILGYDSTSEEIRRQTIFKARDNGVPVVTEKLRLAEEEIEVPAFMVFVPVYNINTKAYYGCTLGLFRTDRLILSALEGITDKDDLLFAVYDKNATGTQNHFIYSVKEFEDISSKRTFEQVRREYELHASFEMPIADRIYQIVYLPSANFLSKNGRFEKWVVLFLPWIFSIFAILISIIVIKGWEYSQHQSKMKQERVKLLESAKKSLESLLAKVGIEEQKNAAIMNGLPDSVITLDNNGKIVHYNSTFEKVFQYNTEDIESLKDITTILPSFNLNDVSNALKNDDCYEQNNTNAITRSGINIPMKVTVTCCKLIVNAKASTNDASSEELPQVLVDAFIIVMRDLREKEQLLTRLHQELSNIERLQNLVDFDELMRNPERKKQFIDFCKKEMSDENVLFLEAVENYRSLPRIEQRTAKQMEIYETFIKPGSKKQINISSVESEGGKIVNSIARVQLFDKLERIAKNYIVQDTFARFKIQNPDLTEDTKTTSLNLSSLSE